MEYQKIIDECVGRYNEQNQPEAWEFDSSELRTLLESYGKAVKESCIADFSNPNDFATDIITDTELPPIKL